MLVLVADQAQRALEAGETQTIMSSWPELEIT